MLAERFTADLSAHLQSRNGSKPAPTIEDRGAWNCPPVRGAHIARGEEALGYAYPGGRHGLSSVCAWATAATTRSALTAATRWRR
ncbi:MAG: hypothetical protein R3A10_20335 [Caldilineaceae bacterium]